MARIKGSLKTGGRTKGSKNKKTTAKHIDELFESVEDNTVLKETINAFIERKETTIEEMRRFARSYGFAAIQRLAELAGLKEVENPENKPELRLLQLKIYEDPKSMGLATDRLLDRAYGKATQDHTNSDGSMKTQQVINIPQCYLPLKKDEG